ncbi:hypothetical protein [Tenacibaculum maritimum]|uniref:hypothetical protein n=1 Tax=Tenacibaculum maritimum TaxID=107401 RepID=UPI0010A565FF|nr:hypothetical protein [Tenacibaculum maritimum]MCD9610967.1 hypothetical protein [Tenacibaculum maritimum]MCD9619473.1 hypothetical protein [Tenacibaculum maritimum]MCD9629177.1 hypothetical protein [Tenacibaculum maritimum]MCD9631602.1 hypothetical protein [Tenacibaculum maritimum]
MLFILLGLLVYQRIIRSAYGEVKNYLSKVTKERSQKQLEGDIIETVKRIQQLDKILGERKFDENFMQQEILEFLSEESRKNEIEITALKKTHFYKNKNYMLVTNVYTLKGGYNSLIELLYNIEVKFSKSKLNKVRFYTKKDYQLKENKLYIDLFFQNFKEIEFE